MIALVSYFGDFARFGEACIRSIAENSPATRTLTPPIEGLDLWWPDAPRSFAANTAKLCAWAEAFMDADEPTVLLDADTVVLGDLADGFGGVVDVGLTTRPGLCGYNGGVVFLNPTGAARRFVHRWVRINERLMHDPSAYQGIRSTYGGVNQAALVNLTMNPPAGCGIAALDGRVWNCVDEIWESFGSHTRILHVKGNARHLLGAGGLADERTGIGRAQRAWLRYDEQPAALDRVTVAG